MGHAQLETTMLYLHLTQKSHRCHHGLSYGGLRDGALPVRQLR
jgi:hypothetical protein